MGDASPLTYEAKLIQEHKERRQRIASRAVQDKPVICLGALARSALAPVFVPAPKVDHFKRWFSIIEEIKPAAPEIRVRPSAIRQIQAIVCDFYEISFGFLIAERRTKGVVRPRQVGMALAKEFTTRSFPEIGRRFGNRDHTTVLYACRKIEQLEPMDGQLAGELAILRDRVRGALK